MELKSEQLKSSGFSAALHEAFTVSAIDAPSCQREVTLVELRNRPAPAGYEQFSLQFVGPVEPVMAQGTYQFVHHALGELHLFMVPVGKSAGGVQYEVCISRSHEKA